MADRAKRLAKLEELKRARLGEANRSKEYKVSSSCRETLTTIRKQHRRVHWMKEGKHARERAQDRNQISSTSG